MTVKMTAKDWQAKGDAYEEAAEHLGQGHMVAAELMKRAEQCWSKAANPPQSR